MDIKTLIKSDKSLETLHLIAWKATPKISFWGKRQIVIEKVELKGKEYDGTLDSLEELIHPFKWAIRHEGDRIERIQQAAANTLLGRIKRVFGLQEPFFESYGFINIKESSKYYCNKYYNCLLGRIRQLCLLEEEEYKKSTTFTRILFNIRNVFECMLDILSGRWFNRTLEAAYENHYANRRLRAEQRRSPSVCNFIAQSDGSLAPCPSRHEIFQDRTRAWRI